MLQDLKYGLRRLRQSPVFTLIAVLALGLGIGANTAIFSLLDAVVLRPLPYPDPGRMVRIWLHSPEEGLDKSPSSVPRLRMLRDAGLFAALTAYHEEAFNLTERGDPEVLHGERIDHELFDVWGVEPLRGRRFSAAEDQKGGADVVMLSAGFWRRRFGGDPGIVGKTIRLEGRPHTIVGVMPDILRFPFRTVQVWLPRPQELGMLIESVVERGAGFLDLAARLKPGTSLRAVRKDALRVDDHYAKTFPSNLDAPFHFAMAPMAGELVGGEVRSRLGLLLGAVALVLLIACADVANLLLVQGLARRKEVAIRMAMGASAGRVIRQQVAEGVVLALLGSLVGLVLAWAGLRLLIVSHPANLPRLDQVEIDGRVLLFTLLLSLLTGVLFSLIPALQSLRAGAAAQLKESSRGSTAGPGRARAQGLFVAAEVALALVLLIGATLLIESFRRLSAVDLGFNPAKLLSIQIALPATKYPDRGRQRAFYETVLERVRSLPGVESAAITDYLPIQGSAQAPIYAEEHPPATPADRTYAFLMNVSPGFFRTMETPLVKGTDFDPRMPPDAPITAVINESMARQYFPGQDPVRKRLILGKYPVEVVGVARDVQQLGPEVRNTPGFFLPLRRHGELPMPVMHLLVRTTLPPAAIAASIRREVTAVDPEQPVADIETLDAVVADALAGRRLTMSLLSGFSAVALLLCALGIYGLIAHSVTARRQEIGVRMALGARQDQVLTVVMRQGFRWVLLGLAAGLVATLVLSRTLSGLLYGVSARDPRYYLTAPLVLGLIALLACYLPARRAAEVEPAVTLRAEE
ncbi:MAG TPA: ABC transporter permease [Thermoanaerobaculia bacterium]|jgi:putative ABC transport system permease protein